MGRIYHEVKPVNGIPEMTEQQIKDIVSHNPLRDEKHQVTKDTLISSLESLRLVYAEHTGRDKDPVRTSDHEPCMGLDGRCGSTDFIRTGTCFVCVHCGSSQGCS